MKDYIIDKVSWHTTRPRNFEFDVTLIYKYFKGIIEYLQKNGLTAKSIIAEGEEITEETQIMASDLTEEGLLLVKAAYGKWTEKVADQKISSDDYRLLDKALKKIRTS